MNMDFDALNKASDEDYSDEYSDEDEAIDHLVNAPKQEYHNSDEKLLVRTNGINSENFKNEQITISNNNIVENKKKYTVSESKMGRMGTARNKSKPSMKVLIENAIQTLNERNGSSFYAIKKFVTTSLGESNTYKIVHLKKALLKLIGDGLVVQTKGNGLSGSFKISTIQIQMKKKEGRAREKTMKLKEKKEAKEMKEKAHQKDKSKQQKKVTEDKEMKNPKKMVKSAKDNDKMLVKSSKASANSKSEDISTSKTKETKSTKKKEVKNIMNKSKSLAKTEKIVKKNKKNVLNISIGSLGVPVPRPMSKKKLSKGAAKLTNGKQQSKAKATAA